VVGESRAVFGVKDLTRDISSLCVMSLLGEYELVFLAFLSGLHVFLFVSGESVVFLPGDGVVCSRNSSSGEFVCS